ncbi:hypothetical protein ACKGJO_05555 [Gracilimonas sp. Q87]|uniref:hypothetical protein n=1 Tax=Gracilimonas sp. Q87 TaxID=3384766 RepID=UPI003984292E
MKNLPFIFMQKVSTAIKAHFDKNPNDLIVLSFGAFVLTFILLVTPHMPQTSPPTYAEQQESIQQANSDLNNTSAGEEDKMILKAHLK